MAPRNVLDFSRAALFSAAVIVPCGPLATGCSSGPDDGPSETLAHTETGTASMPLLTTVNGNVYRLNNASVVVCGVTCTLLGGSDDPAETVLTTTLQTGSYYAYLQFWELQKRDSTGAFQPVQATLVSGPTSSFQVFNGTTTTISYRFQTEGTIVTVGQGAVDVTVDVTEVAPACTPFGADCAAGSWCAPSELTGSQLACITGGSVAPGELCTDVTSCVSGASCFELGSSPAVCVALCPSSELGQPCPSGGICEAAGTTYGLCR